MGTAIRIEALPARLGDCLLVECLREGERPWRMLVDGGPPDTWPLLEARLSALPDRVVDVAVVTHIDSDHIGGFIPFARSAFAQNVGDFWFNGRPQLETLPDVTRSVAQGEQVSAALEGRDEDGEVRHPPLPWNRAFGGGAIESGDEAGFREVAVPGGPRITVLSPTRKRLQILAAKWLDAVRDAQRGDEAPTPPETPPPLGELEPLAAEVWPKDASAPNGSSIALLVEHRGASVVLSGDAFGSVLGAGLAGLAAARGVPTVEVDAFKLPHHGSRGNVLAAMLAAAPARHYLVSTNGDVFRHPDDAALARTVLSASRGATVWFNYRNARTERWADAALRARYGHEVRFPDGPSAGAVVELEERG